MRKKVLPALLALAMLLSLLPGTVFAAEPDMGDSNGIMTVAAEPSDNPEILEFGYYAKGEDFEKAFPNVKDAHDSQDVFYVKLASPLSEGKSMYLMVVTTTDPTGQDLQKLDGNVGGINCIGDGKSNLYYWTFETGKKGLAGAGAVQFDASKTYMLVGEIYDSASTAPWKEGGSAKGKVQQWAQSSERIKTNTVSRTAKPTIDPATVTALDGNLSAELVVTNAASYEGKDVVVTVYNSTGSALETGVTGAYSNGKITLTFESAMSKNVTCQIAMTLAGQVESEKTSAITVKRFVTAPTFDKITYSSNDAENNKFTLIIADEETAAKYAVYSAETAGKKLVTSDTAPAGKNLTFTLDAALDGPSKEVYIAAVDSEGNESTRTKVTLTSYVAGTDANLSAIASETEGFVAPETIPEAGSFSNMTEVNLTVPYKKEGQTVKLTLTAADTKASIAYSKSYPSTAGQIKDKYSDGISDLSVKHSTPVTIYVKVTADDTTTFGYYKLVLTMVDPATDSGIKTLTVAGTVDAEDPVTPEGIPAEKGGTKDAPVELTVEIPYNHDGDTATVKVETNDTNATAKYDTTSISGEYTSEVGESFTVAGVSTAAPKDVYIKVTAEDDSETYYKLTITMKAGEAEALLTSITVNNAEGVEGDITQTTIPERGEDNAEGKPAEMEVTVPYANKGQEITIGVTASDKATVTYGDAAASASSAVTEGKITVSSLTADKVIYIKVVSEDQESQTTYYKLTIKLGEPDKEAAITAINIAGYDAKAKEESTGNGEQATPYEWTVSMPEDTPLTSAAVKVIADKANANKVEYQVADSWSKGTGLSRDGTDKTLWTGSVSGSLNFEANKTIIFAITAQDESTTTYYKVTLEEAPVEIESMEKPTVDTTFTNLKTELEKIDNDAVTNLDSAETAVANEVIKAAAEGKGNYSEDKLKAELGVTSAEEVHYYVVPSLEIEVVEYATTGGAEKFVLDITPTYEVIASDKATYAEVREDNSFVVASGTLQPEEGTPAEIKISIPKEYFDNSATGGKLYYRVEGETGFTEATLDDQNLTVKFPHFSQIEIKKTAGIAKMGEVYYDTLREAVEEAVKTDNYDVTITLSGKPNVDDIITVSKPGKITLKDGGTYEAESDVEALKKLLVPDTSKLEALADGNPSGGDDMTSTGLVFTFTAKSTPTPPPSGPSSSPVSNPATVNSASAVDGSFTVSNTSAKAGDTVKIAPKADKGYVVDEVAVTDKNGKAVEVTKNADGTYSFVMPKDTPVSVSVTFMCDGGDSCLTKVFPDVDQSEWYHKYVDYAVRNGIMKGNDDGTFAPDTPTTRAELVTMLWRLEKEPEAEASSFKDVQEGDWFADPVAWAAANKIVDGYDDGNFGPNDYVTREQAVAILYRYAKFKGYDVTAQDDLADFTDAGELSFDDAKTGMRWAVAVELIKGETPTTLEPADDTTRAEVATILMRFCENIVK